MGHRRDGRSDRNGSTNGMPRAEPVVSGGPPEPLDVVVPAGPSAWIRVDLSYDTGIR
jgi:hypothetical protein